MALIFSIHGVPRIRVRQYPELDMILIASLTSPSFPEKIDSYCNRAIAGISLISSMAVALFFGFALLMAKPAFANESCGGINLVAQITDKDVLAQIDAEAAARPNGNGLLWRIKKENLPDSYLFGTMHVTDMRVLNLPANAQAAFEKSTSLIIETTDVLDPAKASAAMLKRPELMNFTDGTNLEQLIPADDLDMVKAELSKRGMPLGAVKMFKPWMLAAMLATPSCEAKRKSEGIEILDISLATRAEIAEKPVLGLESMEEQISAMASLPMKDHINGLVETLRMADLTDDMFETMIALYTEGNTARMMPALGAALEAKTGKSELPDLEAQAAFEEKMITNRNTVMATRLPEKLAKGGAFVAIGALHLAGELGVIQQLRDAGYALEAVK
jgi:uncharacterized protein